MAIATAAGVTYTIQPNRPGSGARNNGGAATKITSTTLMNRGVSISRYSTGVFGSTVIDNAYADKAFSSGTFSYNNLRPIGLRVTTVLGGVSNTILRSGANVPSLTRSIAKIEKQRTLLITTAIRAGAWNVYSGVFSPAVSSQLDKSFGDSFYNDKAAAPTRSAPGRLIFKGGSLTPVTTGYAAKTGG
jgi:hypothetical protein